MTRPMGEPTPTKRVGVIQKATRELQRRPAPASGSSSDLAWAYAGGSFTGTPTSNIYRPRWTSLRTNTTGFVQGTSISGGSAATIQLNEAGYYLIRAAVYLQSAGTFDTGSVNEFVITYIDGGLPLRIQNGIGVADTSGMMWTDIAMQRTGEVGGLSLFDSLTFNYNPDSPVSNLDFASPLNLGAQLDVEFNTSSRTLGFEMWLVRLAVTPGYGADLIT